LAQKAAEDQDFLTEIPLTAYPAGDVFK